MAATDEWQESVAEPDPVTLVGVIGLQVRPDGTVSENRTVPGKPLRADTVIVEVAEDPALFGAGDVEVIVKSWNRNITVALCASRPLVPVIVTVKLPAMADLHESVADPDPVTLFGVTGLQVRLEGKELERTTIPEKWF